MMNDNEIIKALDCCINCKCKECPCYKNIEGEMRCTEIDEEEILDLINRQKVEIERLKKNALPKEGFFNLLCGALVYTKTLEEYNEFRRIIKSEVIKEFAERLKEKMHSGITMSGESVLFIHPRGIDNLVKELTER